MGDQDTYEPLDTFGEQDTLANRFHFLGSKIKGRSGIKIRILLPPPAGRSVDVGRALLYHVEKSIIYRILSVQMDFGNEAH